MTLYEYCKERDREELLQQWHPVRNDALTPQEVSYGSKKKIWWRCEKGHEWQAVVYSRTSGKGCPYCMGKKVYVGQNDLASQQPNVAAQWHPTKNADVTPMDVLVGSYYKAWWRCEKGHEWQAIVKSRVSGTGCPFCTNRRLLVGQNDLAATHPSLACQWHPVKNGKLTPQDVVFGTRRKVWWRCEKGHEWYATVASRASGGMGCPVCSGKLIVCGQNDFASRFPEIAAQWHPVRNDTLTPDSISPYSNRRVWWQCTMGHEYIMAVSDRTTRRAGCPYCAGRKVLVGFNDLATVQPDIAAQWHPVLNGALTPEMVTEGSHKKVWWECAEGHVWKAVIYSRAGGSKCGCPICAGKVRKNQHDKYLEALVQQKNGL